MLSCMFRIDLYTQKCKWGNLREIKTIYYCYYIVALAAPILDVGADTGGNNDEVSAYLKNLSVYVD